MIVIQEQWDEGYCGYSGCGEIILLQDTISQQFTIKDWKIQEESQSNDSQDCNDVGRWLVKTLLLIRETEVANENMHCDWSAEDDWEFAVSLTKRPVSLNPLRINKDNHK